MAQGDAPAFSTQTPVIENSANTISFSMPVLNVGTGPATNLLLRTVKVDAATRIEPTLPLFLGKLSPHHFTLINAMFSSVGLTVGAKYLLTVQGNYEFDNVTYGFSLNRYLTIPAATAPAIALLNAHVDVTVDRQIGRWSYTIVNDETADSPRFINAISLDIVDPVAVTGTPSGWTVDTDNFSFVLWFAADDQLPFPHHVAPGGRLGGFQIQNQSGRRNSEAGGFAITSWNHNGNHADLVKLGTTSVPARS
jgi:hypothetical protein